MASTPPPRVLTLLQQLHPLVPDEAAYGRMYGDLQDLLEASAWLLETFAAHEGRSLTVSDLEDLLIDIDVKFVEHVSLHLASLRKDLKATLDNLPDAE